MRVVLDTVVLVRGLINPFSRCGRLVFELTGRFEWVVSPSIVDKYLDVLSRAELVRKYRTVATRDLQVMLDQIATATVVQPTETPSICRDPADDKFLAAATAGEVEFMVTEDEDLLVLESYTGIAIISAEAILRILEEAGSQQE